MFLFCQEYRFKEKEVSVQNNQGDIKKLIKIEKNVR
jgi:hypothetical protein